jgi:hypothetical protein
VEWTASTIFFPEVGSRIGFSYYPWGRWDTEDAATLHLPLVDASPDLVVLANRTTLDVPGDTVEFTAHAPGSELLHVLQWLWVPQDSSQHSTTPCLSGHNPCEASVGESGTMEVVARVDGQLRNAAVAIVVDEELGMPALNCSSPVRGGPLDCFLTGGTDYSVLSWQYRSPNGAPIAEKTSGDMQFWRGTVAASGRIVAYVRRGASSPIPVWQSIDLDSRHWPWLEYATYDSAGAPIQYDGRDLSKMDVYGWLCEIREGCPMKTSGSKTLHPSSASRAGYSLTQIADNGPNHGVWYVSNATHSMRLGSNVNPFIQPGAVEYQLTSKDDKERCRPRARANFFTYNHFCVGQDINVFISKVWEHERDHAYQAFSQGMVTNPRNYIEQLWSTSRDELVDFITAEVERAEREIGQTIHTLTHASRFWSGTVWVRATNGTWVPKFIAL